MMGTDKGKRQAKEYGMELTHFDENGKAVMVDVTEKQDSVREATAAGKILVNRQVYEAIQAGAVGKGAGGCRYGRDYGSKTDCRIDSDVSYSAAYELQDSF